MKNIRGINKALNNDWKLLINVCDDNVRKMTVVKPEKELEEVTTYTGENFKHLLERASLNLQSDYAELYEITVGDDKPTSFIDFVLMLGGKMVLLANEENIKLVISLKSFYKIKYKAEVKKGTNIAPMLKKAENDIREQFRKTYDYIDDYAYNEIINK